MKSLDDFTIGMKVREIDWMGQFPRGASLEVTEVDYERKIVELTFGETVLWDDCWTNLEKVEDAPEYVLTTAGAMLTGTEDYIGKPVVRETDSLKLCGSGELCFTIPHEPRYARNDPRRYVCLRPEHYEIKKA